MGPGFPGDQQAAIHLLELSLIDPTVTYRLVEDAPTGGDAIEHAVPIFKTRLKILKTALSKQIFRFFRLSQLAGTETPEFAHPFKRAE
jgi:hypothetical protein